MLLLYVTFIYKAYEKFIEYILYLSVWENWSAQFSKTEYLILTVLISLWFLLKFKIICSSWH
jgi:hypothetical protein